MLGLATPPPPPHSLWGTPPPPGGQGGGGVVGKWASVPPSLTPWGNLLLAPPGPGGLYRGLEKNLVKNFFF